MLCMMSQLDIPKQGSTIQRRTRAFAELGRQLWIVMKKHIYGDREARIDVELNIKDRIYKN